MKLKQLSLFLENRPGQLVQAAQALKEAGVNILTLSLADTEQFGILRLIVSDWEKGKRALEAHQCVVNAADVAALEVSDRPGGLAEILGIIEECGINIEYMYAFTFGRDGKAILIFRFEEVDEAIAKLQARNVNVIGSVELFELSGGR
ncbi:MAG: ACT domain-containing protein [bacterium]|nr:ACT domain-containing protein [bacterium]